MWVQPKNKLGPNGETPGAEPTDSSSQGLEYYLGETLAKLYRSVFGGASVEEPAPASAEGPTPAEEEPASAEEELAPRDEL